VALVAGWFPVLLVGLPVAALFCTLYWWFGERKWWKLLLLSLTGLVGGTVSFYLLLSILDSIKLVKEAPTQEFSNIVNVLSETQKSQFGKDIDAIKLYFGTFDESARLLSTIVAFALTGLGSFIPVICGLIAIDRT